MGGAPATAPGGSLLVTRSTEQANVVLGTRGLVATDPRRHVMSVLNAVLGGGMSSRLFQEIREKRGLAYSVYSFSSGHADTGLFGLYAGVVADLTHTMGSHALQPFWFLHDEIHGEHGSEAVAGYVRTWSPRLSLHAALRHSAAWERRHEVAVAIGVGLREGVERTAQWLQELHRDSVNVASFPLDRENRWAMLVRDRQSDKAQGLARLCLREGIDASQVAVVGDWINDVPMFQWAGRSFAMGQSPDEVAKHATERLTKTAKTGGGVAEAIGRLLG